MHVHKGGVHLEYVMGLGADVRDDDTVTRNSFKLHVCYAPTTCWELLHCW